MNELEDFQPNEQIYDFTTMEAETEDWDPVVRSLSYLVIQFWLFQGGSFVN